MSGEDLGKKDTFAVSMIIVVITIIILIYLLYLQTTSKKKNSYMVQYIEPHTGGWTYQDAKKIASTLGGRMADSSKVKMNHQGWAFGRKLGSEKNGWVIISDETNLKSGFYYFGLPLSSSAKQYLYTSNDE